MAIDCEVRHKLPEPYGLTIELSAHHWPAKRSDSVWVSEDAFGFLEPSVKRCCARYQQYSHYGITRISREEWQAIVEDWRRLVVELDHAATAEAYKETVYFFSDEARTEFNDNFATVRSALSVMVDELNEWATSVLANQDSIFMNGI